jgi:nitrate reductase gamma subunit
MNYFNEIFFKVFPYVSIIIFILFSLKRYFGEPFSYSSLSSQFLENKLHFWALVPFHFGIIFILFGHLFAFLLPDYILAWNSNISRLYLLEVSAFIGGLFTLIGLVNIFIRRLTNSKAAIVTSKMDWIVLTLILIQVITGLLTAVLHSWGSSWFATSASPYIWSIFSFTPQIDYVTSMPFNVKFHIIGTFVILMLFPFTRLVHILVVPNPYLWRRPQMVRWNWNKRRRFIK